MATVAAIQVGDEWHCVEDDDGYNLFFLSNLTEQCDNCGMGGDQGGYLFIGERSGGNDGYSCDQCGRFYLISQRDEDEVIF